VPHGQETMDYTRGIRLVTAYSNPYMTAHSSPYKRYKGPTGSRQKFACELHGL